MNCENFVLLFIAKQIAVVFIGDTLIGIDVYDTTKTYDIPPEWYLIAKQTFENRIWN